MGVLLTVFPQLSFLSRCNNENEWYQIHENIIRKSNTKYSAPSTNYGKYGVAADLLPVCLPGTGFLGFLAVGIWRWNMSQSVQSENLLAGEK